MVEKAFLPGLLSRLPQPPRKVIILRASRIGDFICAIPEAEISILTLPMLKDLALRSPYLDRFINFPGFPGLAEQFFDARRALKFFQEMQAERFDLAIQLQGSGVNSNPFVLMLGAKATAGFVRQGDPAGRLDAALPLPEQGHEVKRTLALISFLGAAPQGQATEFPLWPEDHAEADTLLSGAELPLIGLHTDARQKTRRWPLERFTAAARLLWQRLGGSIIWIGEAVNHQAIQQLNQDTRGAVIDLTGKTSLGALGAVISRLAVLITNDSGPAHIAYALGTPTVTLFGGGDPLRYGPPQPGPFRPLVYQVPCRPCSYDECPIGYVCLNQITVNRVVEAAGQVIRKEVTK
jgi:ADP-heptose:LPS heptosyltransferase